MCFAGPHVDVHCWKSQGQRSHRTFVRLAQLVAEKAVNNVLGNRFSTLDFLVFVDFLVDVRNETEESILQGSFQKNQFYSQIVELMNITTSRAP